MKKIQTKKGFTLIELIIYMGIFSMLLFVLTDIFVISLKTKTSAESTADINQDGRFIFSKLTNDINNAISIISPTLNSTSASLQLDSETVQLNNGNIELITGGQTYVLNSVNTVVTNLAFTRLGNNSINSKNTIKIDLALKSRQIVNNNPEIINLRTTVGLR